MEFTVDHVSIKIPKVWDLKRLQVGIHIPYWEGDPSHSVGLEALPLRTLPGSLRPHISLHHSCSSVFFVSLGSPADYSSN